MMTPSEDTVLEWPTGLLSFQQPLTLQTGAAQPGRVWALPSGQTRGR